MGGLFFHAGFQSVLKSELFHERVKRFHFSGGGFFRAETPCKFRQGKAYPFAQCINGFQTFPLFICPVFPVTVRVFRPWNVTYPHFAVNVPFQNVIFQNVAFLYGKPGQTGFQPAEHIIIFVTVGNGRKHPG